MDSQTTIQIDAISNQGCKVSLWDNMAYHLEGKDIHLIVTYLYFLVVCQAVCFGGKLVRMLTNLGQPNRPYSQASLNNSAER